MKSKSSDRILKILSSSMEPAEQFQILPDRLHLAQFRGTLSDQIEPNTAFLFGGGKDLLPRRLALAEKRRFLVYRRPISGQNAVVASRILLNKCHRIRVLAASPN